MEISIICTKSNSIKDALNQEECPYCGMENNGEHINSCEAAKHNKNINQTEHKWCNHKTLGKSMILDSSDGLALLENDDGRYVVPLSDVNGTNIHELLHYIENQNLSEDEVKMLINALRVMSKDIVLPKSPKLWKGCIVEILCGSSTENATIVKVNGNGYKIRLDSNGDEMIIYNKNIVRILGQR